MLHSGPSGFRHAPLNKVIVFVTTGCTLLVSLANLRPLFAVSSLKDVWNHGSFWKLITNQLFFSAPGESMFALMLLYSFRVFERRMGTSRYAIFVIFTQAVAFALQFAFVLLFPSWLHFLPSGPYALVFAHMVEFYSSIPATGRFRLLGLTLTEKVFSYVLAAQLAAAHGWPSISLAASGLIAGALYQADALPLRTTEIPTRISAFFRATLGPLINANNNSGPHVHRPRTRAPMGPPANAAAAAAAAAPPTVPVVSRAAAPSEEHIQTIMAMGFSREVAVSVLANTENDINLAINSLLDS